MRRSIKQIAAVVVLSIAVLGSQPILAATHSRSADPMGPISRTFATIMAKIHKLFHFGPQDDPVIPHP